MTMPADPRLALPEHLRQLADAHGRAPAVTMLDTTPTAAVPRAPTSTVIAAMPSATSDSAE